MLIRRRIAVLFIAAACCLTLLTVRLVYLQVVQADRLTALALEQRLRPVPLLAQRGAIFDRNMNKLADSMSFEAAYVVPIEVEDADKTARMLAPVLQMDVDRLKERLTRRRAIEWLKLRLTPEEADEVRRLDLPGIGVQERPLRYYPNGQLGAALLGFAGIDNQGLEGLERHYDEYLKGQDGMIVQERDATGRSIPGGIERRVDPMDGFDLVLTIDQVIQYIAERELERGVLEADADWGIFVGMDPRTGEVLAMANYPSFDPNNYGAYPSDTWRNKAVTDYFEPGSTFKVVTAASALESGVATLDSEYVDPVRLQIGGGYVNCWRHGGHGRQTFVEALENSCNPIFSILADEMSGPVFHRYITAFGFGGRLGIDFPGESQGSVPPPDARVLRWANVGFGQGIGTTPVQLVAAVSAIANGGELLQPYIVSEVRGNDGEIIISRSRNVLRRPISAETAREMAASMRSVVENGSGRNADIPGYDVAGKTGTAQIASPQGGYLQGHKSNMAGFLAFAPYDDPVFAGVVLLYRVGREPAYGGLWAAPVFQRIAEEALDYMGIPRRQESEDISDGLVRVPNVINLAKDDAEEVLMVHGFNVVSEGVHGFVVDQTPPPGARVDPGTRVVLTFYDTHDHTGEEVEVPDLRGRSMKDAATQLARVGLGIVIEGNGFAVSQEPAPGTVVHQGDVVSVRFAPPAQ